MAFLHFNSHAITRNEIFFKIKEFFFESDTRSIQTRSGPKETNSLETFLWRVLRIQFSCQFRDFGIQALLLEKSVQKIHKCFGRAQLFVYFGQVFHKCILGLQDFRTDIQTLAFVGSKVSLDGIVTRTLSMQVQH